MVSPNLRILCVDDHEDTRLFIDVWLKALGYTVTIADCVSEGLRLAKTRSFDLLLLDYKFADGTGKELCEKIREFDETTPIIFFTASHPRIEKEALACGAQGFVLKPEIDALNREIDRVLHAA